jgi:hypothetical protein
MDKTHAPYMRTAPGDADDKQAEIDAEFEAEFARELEAEAAAAKKGVDQTPSALCRPLRPKRGRRTLRPASDLCSDRLSRR